MGFFPKKKKLLKNDLNNLSNLNSSIVFFVSSNKFNKIKPLLIKNFSGRKIFICREMTKFYEEYIRTEVDKIHEVNFEIKGELTIVISEKKNYTNYSQELSESDKKIINKMINKLSIKEITSLINERNKISKKKIYDYCLEIKNKN